MRKQATLLLLAVLALTACDSGGVPDPNVLEPPGDPVCLTGEHFPMVAEFVGLTETEAIDLANERLLTIREVGRDGECFPVTDDLREDRLNLEFIGDRVVAAALY